MNNLIQTAVSQLKAADDILIITHRRPDGDTAGCAGGLVQALRNIGKNAYVLKNSDATPRYGKLISNFYPNEDFKPQFIVSVDTGDTGLFTENAQIYADKVDLCIDHHRSNSLYAKTSVVFPEYAACGEIIYRVIEQLGTPITAEIAYPIYIAISTDTGCFRYSNTTAHTHEIAALCLKTGIDGGEINREIFETKSRPRFEMERIIFDNIQFYLEGKIAIVQILQSDLQKTGADIDDLDAISALPRQIEGVEVGITLQENKNNSVKISVRTNKDINAAAICENFGGGGHLRAAGATIDGNIKEALDRIVEVSEAMYA